MPGWIEQWYEYVPSVWNVNEKWPPGGTVPEFQPFISDVDVCATESLLVHVTVVPAATLKSSGANARLPSTSAPVGMVTAAEAPPADGGGDGDGDGDGDAGDDEYELPHAIENARTVEIRASRSVNIRTSFVTGFVRSGAVLTSAAFVCACPRPQNSEHTTSYRPISGCSDATNLISPIQTIREPDIFQRASSPA
jgi:hypothetical protein